VLDPENPGDIYREGHVIINLWKGFIVKELTQYNKEEIDRHVSPFLNHIKQCWCNNNLELYIQVINHFVHIFKYPWKRDQINVILRSTTRRCVDVVFEPIRKILAPKHFSNVIGKGVITNSVSQNDTWSQSLILLLNEPISRYDVISNIIENDQIFIKYKCHKPIMAKNIINLFVHTTDSAAKFQTLKFKNLSLELNENQVSNEILQDIENTDPQILLTWFLHQ
jgi:hypothetical protein